MKIIPKFMSSVAHGHICSSHKSGNARKKTAPDTFGACISAPLPKYSQKIINQSDGLCDADFGHKTEVYVKAMRSGERERDQGNNVIYLTPQQRANYELRPRTGQLFRKDGIIPADTTLFYGKRALLYVISPDKKIYCGRGARFILHHSSFLAGEEVIAAGKLMTSNGKVIFMSNNSGHYRPSAEHLLQAAQHFHDLGVLSPDAIIELRHCGKLGLKEGIEVLKNAILAQQNLSINEGQDNTNLQPGPNIA